MRIAWAVCLWLATMAAMGAVGRAQCQILANGGFEAEAANWGLSQQEQARAEFTVVDGDSPAGGRAARIVIIQPGDAHRLQLMHSFHTALLAVGEAYELRFWAQGDQANTVRVNVFTADRPWSTLGLSEEVDLGPGWREYRLPFRVRETSQERSKVDFFLGTCEGVVWLDGVTIVPFERQPLTGNVAIEGDAWSARFTERGALAEFVHKESGQRLVTGAVEDPIYTLTVKGPEGTRTLTNRDAEGPEMARGRDGRRTWSYTHNGIEVYLSAVRLPEDLLALHMSVLCPESAGVVAARYPIVRTPIQLGESSEDDAILIPAFDGGICEDPGVSVPAQGGGFDLYYPGPASCQVLAYYDGQAGLYLAAHDGIGYPKRFTLDADVDFVFGVERPTHTIGGGELLLDYPIVLGAFTGDWYDAAGIYRQWTETQGFTRRPLGWSGKTPEWLARGALVTNFDPRNYGDLGRLRERLGRFAELYGAPLIPNSRGWERWGTWTGQEYLPPLPSEEHFDQTGALIRELDGRGMVMLSGYRWTIEKKQDDGSIYSSQERFDREISRYVVCGEDGEPIVHTSEREDDWHGQKWAMLCRETEFAKQAIVDVAAYCVQHGSPVIHFDQEVSGNYLAGVCHSREHGHPPGHGRYVHDALAQLYERIRERCEPLDPDFVLSMEEPNELYLPYLDLCQCRPFGLTQEWPAVRPMTRTVPLFSFLYHEYVIQWAAFYPWKSAGHPEVSAAKGFAAGLMPGLHPYDYTLPAEGTTPYSEFLARCISMYLGPGREYLIFGRMRKPLPIQIPERELDLGQQWGKTTVPAFFHSVWELDDGRLGIVLVNPEDDEHTLTIDRAWFRSGWPKEAAPVQPAGEEWGGRELQVVVPPGDAVVVETTPWGTPA